MPKAYRTFSDAEIKNWLSSVKFPLISCDIKMAASALLMLNREAGVGYYSRGQSKQIKSAAIFITAQGYTEINDKVWRACASISNEGRVLRGITLLGYFCIYGHAIRFKDLPNKKYSCFFSPFYTLTSCYQMLNKTREELKKNFSSKTLTVLLTELNWLIQFAYNSNENDLTYDLCMRALKERVTVSKLLHVVIKCIDRLFTMHWENPTKKRPYNPLQLPSLKEADIYFNNRKEDQPLRIDMLIVKAIEALKLFGEKEGSVKYYAQDMHRFHWFSFKLGEKYYSSDLYDNFLKSQNFIDISNKLKKKHLQAIRCGKVLAAVSSRGSLSADVFKRESFKYDDPGIEQIRIELRAWLTEERNLSLGYAKLQDSIFRNIIRSCHINTTSDLKRLNNTDIDKILNYFNKSYTNKASLASALLIVRDLLKWCYDHGYIKCDLSKGIIRPFCIKTYDPPYLSVSDQKRLDNYIRLNESWRNRAIILLALNLGLRKSDIVKLSLQDIDFKHKTLYIIQRKTGNPLRVPINDVIDVIKNYINLERPRPCINRTEPIFLTTVPPFKPLTNVHCITSGVLKRAGIKAKNGNARGPHLLRYSLVHAMMKVGTNHKIITDTLGHVSEDSDRPYLSMDLEMLRQCALDLSMIGKGRGFE